jgi:ABC-2 type transport system ATP-binding protein
VLDEPTAGVDVELRRQLWELVTELNREGATIVLTTHYLEEAEELCDRIAIINHGRVVACDTKQALLARLDAKELRVTIDCDLGAVPASLVPFGATLDGSNTLVVHYRPSRTRLDELLGAIRSEGIAIVDLSTKESDLEDLFLQLVRSTPAAA